MSPKCHTEHHLCSRLPTVALAATPLTCSAVSPRSLSPPPLSAPLLAASALVTLALAVVAILVAATFFAAAPAVALPVAAPPRRRLCHSCVGAAPPAADALAATMARRAVAAIYAAALNRITLLVL